ncbi:hypothetical protein COLO4_32318 [Corchorus olitorius]|uniref:Uncharacterized protein n=1 Tax=Corchorus olitorius TaxID=93759 RepID=A0A1R3GZH9_9ROSI|nr:hypothetical protein COLO4_32318 [Corchorus olitorius]
MPIALAFGIAQGGGCFSLTIKQLQSEAASRKSQPKPS